MKTVKKRSQFSEPVKRIRYNTFKIKGDVTLMYDLKGNCTLIDTEDVEDVKKFYWYKHPVTHYWISYSHYSEIRLHRFIMNCPNNCIVDHIEHNLDDHRKSKLLICGYSVNNSNRNYMTPHKNIHITSNGKFEVVISINSKLHRFGRYETLDEAISVRDKKRKELHYADC